MILIADSGSTKTQWFLKENSNRAAEYMTLGFNPVLLGSEEIYNGFEKTLISQLKEKADAIDKIYFYGAGCSSIEMQNKIKSILHNLFVKAEIEVRSDLWAGIHALMGNNPGINIILGTGSNICVYNGEKII